MNILLRKCLLICLMPGIFLQGVAASVASGCEHRHLEASVVVLPEPADHHAGHGDDAHDHAHHPASAATGQDACDECGDCAVCIVPPIPVTGSILPVAAPVTDVTASVGSLFLSIILEDPPRPPSVSFLSI